VRVVFTAWCSVLHIHTHQRCRLHVEGHFQSATEVNAVRGLKGEVVP